MSRLLQMLFWCPKCWRSIGYLILSLSGSMLILGWQLSNRVDRIENRTGVVIDFDKMLAAIPLPIPASSAGFALAIFGVLLGLTLMVVGKQMERYQRLY